jgi:hypothetical protein
VKISRFTFSIGFENASWTPDLPTMTLALMSRSILPFICPDHAVAVSTKPGIEIAILVVKSKKPLKYEQFKTLILKILNIGNL